MAQTDAIRLDAGDSFPSMSIQIVGEATPMRLPNDLSAEYTVFLGYRGKW